MHIQIIVRAKSQCNRLVIEVEYILEGWEVIQNVFVYVCIFSHENKGAFCNKLQVLLQCGDLIFDFKSELHLQFLYIEIAIMNDAHQIYLGCKICMVNNSYSCSVAYISWGEKQKRHNYG